MEESGDAVLTEFLLDLSDQADLYEDIIEDDNRLLKEIEERGLDDYRELLLRRDVQGLRDAVRAEVTGSSGDRNRGPNDLETCIIYGIRKPPPPPPAPPPPG